MKHCCCCCCCCSHSACSTCTLMPSRFISQNVGLVQLKLTSRVIPTIHVLRYTDLSRLHFSSQLERIKPVSGKFRYTSNAGSCAMINDNTYHIAVPSRSSHRYQIIQLYVVLSSCIHTVTAGICYANGAYTQSDLQRTALGQNLMYTISSL